MIVSSEQREINIFSQGAFCAYKRGLNGCLHGLSHLGLPQSAFIDRLDPTESPGLVNELLPTGGLHFLVTGLDIRVNGMGTDR